MADESEPVCFVVSPIGDESSSERKKADQLLRYIVRPVLEDRGYVVTRADQIHDPGTISKQVIEHLVTADVVIADMTGHNPNVFYELAVRHAAKMPVVHMIEKGETIPFDVAPQRAIFYELALDGAEDAKTALRKMLGRSRTPTKAASRRLATRSIGSPWVMPATLASGRPRCSNSCRTFICEWSTLSRETPPQDY